MSIDILKKKACFFALKCLYKTKNLNKQNVGEQKYKRTCFTVLGVLSHKAVKIFVS